MQRCFKGRFLVVAALALTLGACGGERARKPTFPVTGKVVVDGQPAEGVIVVAHSKTGYDPNYPTQPQGYTDSSGVFQLSAYETNDGATAGSYALTFEWPEKRQYGAGPDRFKKRYRDVAKSPKELTVNDTAVDLGEIALSLK